VHANGGLSIIISLLHGKCGVCGAAKTLCGLKRLEAAAACWRAGINGIGADGIVLAINRWHLPYIFVRRG